MARAVPLILAAVLAATVAPAATAGSSPKLCGSSGCVTVTISASELAGLLGKRATPAPPPPVQPFFRLAAAPGGAIFVVPSGAYVYFKQVGGGWRALSRSNARPFVNSFQAVSPFAAPIFSGVKVGAALRNDTSAYKEMFGKLGSGPPLPGAGAPPSIRERFRLLFISPRPNPWSNTKLLIDPNRGTAQIGGKTYTLPKSLAELLRRDLSTNESNEPDWEALALAAYGLVAFLLSILRLRYRRRAAQRTERPERTRPVVGALKVAGGLGFASLALATAHGSLAVGVVVAGLILAVSGAVDLAGRDRIGFWIATVPVLIAFAIYLVHTV